MKKISQGKYEIFTTKTDAIDKFMQLQGICREELSDESLIEFYCSKKGKISITNPPKRHAENTNSTYLFAEIIEQNGKTYVLYYTTFSKVNSLLKLILLGIDIIITVFAIISTIISDDKKPYLIVLILGLVFFAFKLFTGTKEEKNSPDDSQILIKELEKRVEAVNQWDR